MSTDEFAQAVLAGLQVRGIKPDKLTVSPGRERIDMHNGNEHVGIAPLPHLGVAEIVDALATLAEEIKARKG